MAHDPAPKIERKLQPQLAVPEEQVAPQISACECPELGDQLVLVTRLLSSSSTADPQLHHDEAIVVRAIIRARHLRNQSFEPQLFSDPAWDILLELYLAKAEQRRVSVSSLSKAAAVPQSTAIRHIGWLASRGLVKRQSNPFDGRVTHVEITEGGCQPMRDFLNRLTDGLDREPQ